ncbi:Ldh family oxidoreductase [Conexibacter sp. CPCC 206217]|uniref:Ldh family oxidoreductase n=1 Tax=Conexibacter sp. CPCC 206217 TaxID=3064574 RepID=UPI00271DC679|nr:Ldh family oxidoreductase [Conexibacter sp. CPCC 206217]MDO8210225.1 Ldh family oxidoreductase [Conexibacter sp. CPCC 206217]
MTAATTELRVDAQRARRLGEAVLHAAGAPAAHAAMQAGALVEGDLRGRPSHGLQRLPTLVQRIRAGVLDPAATAALRWTGEAFLAVDGRDGFGPVAANAAIDALAERVPRSGIALAAIRRSGHIGMLAPYLERICAAGFAAIVLTTSEALVHPAGGRTALVGTNPIGIGVPAKPQPFVLDMSTAAISAGEIIAHAHRGATLPQGRAVDEAGRPTTDPERALAGAISPFGGAKGYGLGVGFELLVALLSATALGRDVHGTLDVDQLATKGDVLIVLDPRASVGDAVASVASRIDDYLDELRAAPTAPGVPAVLVPGDRMRGARARRQRDGIPYPAALWAQLERLEESDV